MIKRHPWKWHLHYGCTCDITWSTINNYAQRCHYYHDILGASENLYVVKQLHQPSYFRINYYKIWKKVLQKCYSPVNGLPFNHKNKKMSANCNSWQRYTKYTQNAVFKSFIKAKKGIQTYIALFEIITLLNQNLIVINII